jgi:site-specific recombinase XerD
MIWLFFLNSSGRAHELLPCGLQWRKLVKLFKKKKSQFYWYDFTVRGKRLRGSTEETNAARASKIAGLKLAAALEGSNPLDRKAPALREFSKKFLEWVTAAKLEQKTKLYYQDGWRLLSQTEIAGMRLDLINNDAVETLSFPGSASNTNCALRTLRRMLHRAEEWKLLRRAPKLKLAKEYGRSLTLNDETEKKLLAGAEACQWMRDIFERFRDVVIMMRDTGMRNERELYRIRLEHLDWQNKTIFVPDSKSEEGRRTIPLSHRVFDLLRARCGTRTEGWLFPAKRGRTGHLTTLAERFREARAKAGISEKMVLYCGRHDYGTRMMKKTGNLKAVMKVMGHRDVKTAMKYQHPEIDIVRAALNQGGSAGGANA